MNFIRNPERKALTESFFSEVKDFEIFISDITLAEIDNTPDEEIKRKMKEKIVSFSILTSSNEIEELVKYIIQNGAINESYSEDTYHIAIAIINDMDFLLSWNFRHTVRGQKLTFESIYEMRK